ncbi:hypothetical protein M422DRAFT_170343 [Sphaerobolus stellatus SS14]|uniref:Reverse transcriptase domain-containing protein n=1 Tax=Sphaerobolus stellatus (strain SS14) TaxID=990650 RepID=A0A0C9VWG8_SPHS4|nr:hypothetical protein M422DRAFT_170343 [Sphaerobolus stellatus SS14]
MSSLGVLQGDPSSPVLYLISCHNFRLPPDIDDLTLDGHTISHLEHADDMVIISSSFEGLQRHLDHLTMWCDRNFMTISNTKSKYMIFGMPPDPLPLPILGGKHILFVNSFTYIGCTFSTTSHNVLAEHYRTKAKTATRVANTILSMTKHVGFLPMQEARELYMGRVDPHLTFGAEVAIDTDKTATAWLEKVQIRFLRRTLGVQSRCSLAPLFTETGLWPVKYRRLDLALRYLRHILEPSPALFTRLALQECLQLHATHHPSWFGDLVIALQRLPVPVFLDEVNPTVSSVDSSRQALADSLMTSLNTAIAESEKLILLQNRQERDDNGNLIQRTCAVRAHLSIPCHPHRVALTRLIFSSHPLAVERLRWVERRRGIIVRNDRIYRLCRLAVEDEAHAVLYCGGSQYILAARQSFFDYLTTSHPHIPRCKRWNDSEVDFLRNILGWPKVLPALARLIHVVFAEFEQEPMHIHEDRADA